MSLIRIAFTGLQMVILLLVQSCQGNDIKLVTDQKPVSEIILPEQASPLEKKSASILQEYVRRITGATLPIQTVPSQNIAHLIYVGSAATRVGQFIEPLKAEGYEIDVRGGNIYLYGGSGKGLLYGVYELIEKQFGARKYDQGPALIPHSRDLGLPAGLHMRYEPVLLYRESYYPSSADPEYLDWHHLHRFEDLWGLWGHSFFKIIPPERNFREHPEYFSWVNGHRQPSQLCLSNPDVLRQAIAYFERATAANPDAIYWSIAPMDGAGYCTCEKCARVDAEEGGPQGSLIRFVNAVAAYFPDQLFTTLAYGYSAEATKHTRPGKNVYVMLSTINSTRHLPVATNPDAVSFRRQLSEWSKLTPNLLLWDYTTDFSAYLSPFPMHDHYVANIRYFQTYGIKGIFEQGSGETLGDMSAYASYIQAKALWDPSLKLDEVQDDFLKGYYGTAAHSIKNYIGQLISARNETQARLGIYDQPFAHRSDYLALDKISSYRQALKEAADAVAGSPELEHKIKTLSLGLEYVELEQAKAYGIQPGGYLEKLREGTWSVKPGWNVRVKSFVSDAQKAGAITLSETGGPLPDYLASWTAILDNPYRPSLILGAKASFSNPFIEDYPANGSATLTDGISGGTDYSYNWLLFAGGMVKIDIPIGRDILPASIQTDFLFDPSHYLFLPEKISVEGSIDGNNYFPIGSHRLDNNVPSDMKARVQTVDCTLKSKQLLRYLRVAIWFPAELPEWFNGSRHRKPLMAIDELSLE